MHHFDGFISYRRESGFFVAQTVKKLLEEKDIICHLDLEQDQVGEFDLRLLDAINNSSCLLLILTEGALDRCINEGDWVRREVMEALEKHIPIIPIEDRHFLWPVHLDDQFPKEFDRLKKMQRVPMVMEYLTAVIDKLAAYMEPCIQRKIHKSSTVNEPPRATADFFLRGMNEPNLQGVDMAFHAGVEWRRVSEKVELLNQLIERNIPVRILVNSADSVEDVCSHMAQKGKEYVGFEENIKGRIAPGMLADFVVLAQNPFDVDPSTIKDIPITRTVSGQAIAAAFR